MSEEVALLKEKGNTCLKAEQHEEAVLHYTYAIKLDPRNYSLYSNRSLAFLKMQQYYLALEDARETISLRPEWAKGYFRKAEVEYQTFNFYDALMSYKIALTLQPNDPSLEEAIKKTRAAIKREKALDYQIPWLGTAIGIFVGALVVVADHVLTVRPVLRHPIIMVFLTVAIAVAGYFLGTTTRLYLKTQRSALLEPPADLLQSEDTNENSDYIEKEKETRTKYSKAQARQRYKKGKS